MNTVERKDTGENDLRESEALAKRVSSGGDAFKIRGLTPAQLAKIKNISGYDGPDGQPFFEGAVWWWRRLLGILGKNCKRCTIPALERREFFPESVFVDIRESQACGDLHGVLNHWFELELFARLAGPQVQGMSWPAFTSPDTRVRYLGQSSEAIHVVRFSTHLDLRKHDDELCADFTEALRRLREERRERIPGLFDDRVRKSSFLSEHSFARIELIDLKKSLGQQVPEDKWANVNKAVRTRRQKFSIFMGED